MIKFVATFLSPWTWRMAWRDSRASRRKLALFSCSIILGIAALTAIGSLGTNLERAIQEQSKGLLGADLVINSRQPFDENEDQLFREIGGDQSREINFSSMVYFTSTEGTRLVQVRALEPGFPFYGALETHPPAAATEFRKGGAALVEESLLTQFGAKVGQEVRIGKLTLRIAGSLKKVPGESIAFATIAPRVYIPMSDLPRAELLGQGSLVRYRVYFKLHPNVDAEQLVRQLRPRLEEYRLGTDTVNERQRELGRSLEHLYHFLNLVGFIALLLGGVGVASAIHVHVKQKLGTVAVLRCLGGTVAQTFAVYLAQGMALGALGAIAGAALGLVIQSALPKVLQDFIPFTFEFRTSWLAVGKGAGIGFGIALLFALMPLLTVRRVSPLAAIRVAFEPASRRDPLLWVVGSLLAGGVIWFALSQSRNWRIGLGFAGALFVGFALLAATARALIFFARKISLARLPFTLRQGLANLHRPNNRTLLLILSLGLGTFLIVSLFLIQRNLLTQLVSSEGHQLANAVLFDIQSDQREPLQRLVQSLNVPILDEAAIVTMRVRSVKGERVDALLKERGRRIPRWALRREYRSTYNDRLRDGERLIAGTWHTHATNTTEAVPVSLEQGIARDLQVGLGDELEFDVQGVPIKTRVASLREVNWRRVQPNFFVVFPRGVLEGAPAMHVLVTRVRSSEESARLQREVVRAFPNVSAIDLSLILQTLDSILGKISFVIRFMAMFTVVTGLLVLAGALLTGRYQRVQESVLLRTLGASRRQIFRILLVEYSVLGLLAALTGILLALLAAWALAAFVFKISYAPSLPPLFVALIGLPLLTVGIGLLLSRGVVSQPPLAVLRAAAASVLLLATPALAEPAEPIADAKFHFGGKVGERIDANVRNWLCRAPAANPAMLEMFAQRDRQPPPNLVDWAGEFVGKYLISGVQAMRMSDDPCLGATLSNVVERLIALQADDGYLGPWPKHERLLGHWDLWGHYHVILGLLMWNEHTGDTNSLIAARRAADLACRIYLDGGRRLLDAGSPEMNMSSLHGFALLYQRTKEPRYLALCEKIIAELPDAGDYLRTGLDGVEFFKTPRPRWESLHALQGLAEMFRITGDERYRRAFLHHHASIRRLDIHNNGAFSSGEQATGNPFSEGAIETCCTIAWAAVMIDALRLTGDPRIADDLELTFYNGICSAQHPSGSWWTYDTPMNGRRAASQHSIVFQSRPGSPELNCCSVNGPRGLGMLSEWALMQGSNRLVLNYLGPMTSSKGVRVKGDYPFGDTVQIETEVPLLVRIPSWSSRYGLIELNGRPQLAIAGKYSVVPAGARVHLKLARSFTLPIWHEIGDREQAGRLSLYRGPLLLAYDQHYNSFDDAAMPVIDFKRLDLAGPATVGPRRGEPAPAASDDSYAVDYKAGVLGLAGLRLIDYANAGSGGTYYRSWLRATNLPPPRPALLKPRVGQRVPPGDIVFAWRRMSDPNLAMTLLISNAMQAPVTNTGYYVLPEGTLEPGKTYHWQLVAKNQHGAAESLGPMRSFYIDPSLPRATNRVPRPDGLLVLATNLIETTGTNFVGYDIEEFPDSDYTVSLRVMMLRPPPQGIGQIFSAWCRGSDDPLRLVVDASSKLYARIEAGRGWSTEGVTIEANRWYDILAVKEGASLELYLDGALVARTDAPGEVHSNSTRIALGGNPLYRGAPEFLAARFADFRLYARAVTP